ncbi:MAG: hypothetical protein U0893_15990 [Chloroflexota bacterium]
MAFLVRHDLLSGSFIPAREQRELREVTRARTALVRERARIVQRLEKTLEGANIKLGAVVTELLGTSGQAMLDATLAGVVTPRNWPAWPTTSWHPSGSCWCRRWPDG